MSLINAWNKDTLVELCKTNTEELYLFFSTVLFKHDLVDEISIILDDDFLYDFIKNSKIINDLYPQSIQIISLFAKYNLVNFEEYKEPYLHKAMSSANTDFLNLVLESITPIYIGNFAFLSSLIIDQKKEFIQAFFNSPKILIDKKIVQSIGQIYDFGEKNADIIEMIILLINIPKILECFNGDWKKHIPKKSHHKFFQVIFSLNDF